MPGEPEPDILKLLYDLDNDFLFIFFKDLQNMILITRS